MSERFGRPNLTGPRGGTVSRARLVAALAAAGLLAACAGAPKRSAISSALLRDAKDMIERGDFHGALLSSHSYLMQPWGDKPEEDLAHSVAAFCNLQLNRPTEALHQVKLLRERFPESSYNNEQLRRVEAKALKIRADAERERAARTQSLLAQIGKTEARVEQNPNDAGARTVLGHLYWLTGRYEDALVQYQGAVDLDRATLQDRQVRGRIKIDDRGRLALKDNPITSQFTGPLKVRRLYVQRETERSFGGFQFDRNRYIVTGEVFNDDIRDHRGVELEVTLFDFFEKILDVRTIRIGSVPAGRARPFFVELDRFAGSEQGVNRYEARVYSGGRQMGGASGTGSAQGRPNG